MIFIKYFFIFCVLCLCTIIGNNYSKKYSIRVQELEEMKNILNVFKAKIRFTAQGIGEIFEQIYQDNQDNIGKIFYDASKLMENENSQKAWQMAVNNAKESTMLKNDDIIAILSLGKMLGNTDVEGQISQIELCINLVQEQINQAMEEKKKNAKLYKTLGMAAGLVLAIILV